MSMNSEFSYKMTIQDYILYCLLYNVYHSRCLKQYLWSLLNTASANVPELQEKGKEKYSQQGVIRNPTVTLTSKFLFPMEVQIKKRFVSW